MKPIMYHYVRPDAEGLPYFPYLSLADFERQLDEFERTYGFVGREGFFVGLKEAPLRRACFSLSTTACAITRNSFFRRSVRGLFGLFYVPSGPISTGCVLDVHKLHLVVGKLGGKAVLGWLQADAPDLLSSVQDHGVAQSYFAAQTSDQARSL